jgi:hypothetical protein
MRNIRHAFGADAQRGEAIEIVLAHMASHGPVLTLEQHTHTALSSGM